MIERLQLLKALTDCGEGIGRIANLPDDDLRARLGLLAGIPGRPLGPEAAETTGAVRVGLLGDRLSQQIESNQLALSGIDVAKAEQEGSRPSGKPEKLSLDAMIAKQYAERMDKKANEGRGERDADGGVDGGGSPGAKGDSGEPKQRTIFDELFGAEWGETFSFGRFWDV